MTQFTESLVVLSDYSYNVLIHKIQFSSTYIRPVIVNYSFIVTRSHRKNLPQNAA